MAIGPGLLAAAFSPLLLGTIAALTREGRTGDVRAMVQQVFRLMLVLLPFIGVLSAAAPDLAVIVYGPAFVQAGIVAGILFFAAAALFSVSITTAVVIALGHPNLALSMAVPLVPVALAAHWIVIPRYGATGAAAVTAVLSWLAAAVGIMVVSQRARVRLPFASWLRVLVVTVAAAGLALDELAEQLLPVGKPGVGDRPDDQHLVFGPHREHGRHEPLGLGRIGAQHASREADIDACTVEFAQDAERTHGLDRFRQPPRLRIVTVIVDPPQDLLGLREGWRLCWRRGNGRQSTEHKGQKDAGDKTHKLLLAGSNPSEADGLHLDHSSGRADQLDNRQWRYCGKRT
jgi:hypothetical protein